MNYVIDDEDEALINVYSANVFEQLPKTQFETYEGTVISVEVGEIDGLRKEDTFGSAKTSLQLRLCLVADVPSTRTKCRVLSMTHVAARYVDAQSPK